MSKKSTLTACFGTMISTCLLFSSSVLGQQLHAVNPGTNGAVPEVITIAKLDDAQVFADFSEKLPAVVNYFTKASEQEVIEFYQASYGDIISQERKRGRLTLTFTQQQQNIRVVISQQNRLRQVDVLVEAI